MCDEYNFLDQIQIQIYVGKKNLKKSNAVNLRVLGIGIYLDPIFETNTNLFGLLNLGKYKLNIYIWTATHEY